MCIIICPAKGLISITGVIVLPVKVAKYVLDVVASTKNELATLKFASTKTVSPVELISAPVSIVTCVPITRLFTYKVSNTPEEYEEYKKKLINVGYYTENIIKQIDNASGRRIKFKDERKITIGISKKDIMNCRGKVKNAFYNCFAIIFRFKNNGLFREIHVKVFNTGKLEIPGILNPGLLVTVKRMLLETMQPFIDSSLEFMETDSEENVLINSNFNCGYLLIVRNYI